MTVKLIPRGKVPFRIKGTEFDIVYATPADFTEIVRECTEVGRTDWTLVTLKTVQRHVKGWSGVVDEQGKELEFSPELIKYLPLNVQNALFDEITKYINDKPIEELEKN